MYSFGSCRIDLRTRELHRDGRPEHLEPQAFDLLAVLIERRDDVVSKEALLDEVWGHRFVSESALTTRIKEVRRAVGDDGRAQHTIRNVRGRGYRFVADVTTTLEDAAGRDPAGANSAGETGLSSNAGAAGLVGRRDEWARVRAAVDAGGVVSLVGPGGVGKSTLARAVASELSGSFGDGVLVVDLSSVEGDVLSAVASATDVVHRAAQPAATVRTLAALGSLLVLDGCEHVIDEAAELVSQLHSTDRPRIRVLATSQVQLGCPQEVVVELRPLATADAVALFEVRADAARSGWGDGVDGARVRQLVDRLDRLPLTIEMAASRLRAMSFAELEGAVGDREVFAAMSHRSPHRRHRTVRSLVEWSVDLLDPALREALVQLSVFAGPVTAAEAAEVLGSRATPALVELAERSLVAVELDRPATRYRLLDTVRSVASSWRAEGGSVELRARHAAALARLAHGIDAQLRGPDEGTARVRLTGSIDDLRVAHGWARANDPELAERLAASLCLASYSWLWHEPGEWSAALVDSGPERDVASFPASWLLVAANAAHGGDLDRAGDLAERVLAGDPPERERGTALEILCDVTMYRGELEQCGRHAVALAEVGAAAGDAHMTDLAAASDSLRRTYQGRPEAGLERLTRSAPPATPTGTAWFDYARGEAHSALGEHEPAVAAYRSAGDLGRSVDNPFIATVAAISLGAELCRAGDLPASFAAFDQCFQLIRRHGNTVHALPAVRNVVALLDRTGDTAEALLLAAAVTDGALRASYGTEADALADLIATADLSGPVADDLRARGRALGLEGAVRLATTLVGRRHA